MFDIDIQNIVSLKSCQCRLSRIVLNHIGAVFLVSVYLMRKASETGQTLYQVKHRLVSEYLSQQLKSPALKISAA